MIKAIRHAIALDRITTLVAGEDYRGAIACFERSRLDAIHGWKLPFLLAESFSKLGETTTSRKYLEISCRDFFMQNHNIDEKRYIAIHFYKRFGYKDDYVRNFFHETGYDSSVDLRKVRSEIKRYAPMKFA